MKLAPGYWITIGLCGSTLFLWSRGETFPWKFVDAMSAWTSIGQIAGLVGITLFSIAMILSARVRWMERLFGGMNRVYIAHHLIGGLAFLFLLVHPILLAISYMLVSPQAAAVFLLPGSDWTVNLGRVALLSLMLLLLFTYYLKLPYQVWRLTHQFMGVAFFFGAIHGIFVASDISRTPALRMYMIILLSCGGLSYLYRTLLGRFFVRKTTYLVKGVRKLANNTTEILMEPETHPMSFRAGQFVFISFDDPHLGRETHPFSLSSPPGNDITISAKSLGNFTTRLPGLPPGTRARIEGPYGAFTQVAAKNPTQIWIAGGIGITPFLSMARTKVDRDIHIHCFYSVKDETESDYADVLQKVAQQSPHFKVYVHFSKQQGRLTAEMIKQTCGDLAHTDIFICGPPAMMYSLKQQLRTLGVSRRDIHTEEFNLL